MKQTALLIYLLFICSLNLNAQDESLQRSGLTVNSGANLKLELPQELKTKSSNFFNKIISHKVDDAYNELLQNSPIADKSDEIRSLKDQTVRSFEIYGKIMSFDLYNYEYVTSNYVRLRYLGLYSKYPIRWLFTYYKSPEKGWVITNVKFDDLTEFYFSD